MTNTAIRGQKGYVRRAIPGYTCGFTVGKSLCAHTRNAHKFDEIDGSSWCDECYADTDPKLREIAYHYFEQGVFANV